MNLSSYEEYSLQSFVLTARMQTELDAHEVLNKRPLEWAGVTFSAQLSFALAEMDYQVGLLDIDICGPSIPKMLGLEGQDIHQSNVGWSPVYVESNLGVMSIGFMLPTQMMLSFGGVLARMDS